MIEFAPTLGEDALIGRAPVRPRGRSSSSSINTHSISSKQQRSSSITNSPDPSIITSDASLSPRIFLHLAVYSGTVAISTEKYTEGLHPERPARGAVLYTGQSRPCIEHKGPPSTKNMHTKDGHDSRGRNYKAETQLPTFAWASLPI